MASPARPTTASEQQPSGEAPKATFGMLMIRIVECRNIVFPESIKDPTKVTPYLVMECDKNEVQVAAKSSATFTASHPTHQTDGHPTPLFSVPWQFRTHFDAFHMADVQISIYIPHGGPNGQELPLATAKMRPSYIDQQLTTEWIPMKTDVDQGIQGEIQIQTCFKAHSKNKSITIDDFDLLKVLGKGSFGKVMQVRKKDTNRVYAMKIIRKSYIVERAEVTHTLAERNVLAQIRHPFIVPLIYSFQSSEKLYLVLAFINGGELFFHLQKEGQFSEDRAKFYVAELFTALECLHSFNIIYRDLKPENILLDYNGHIALCDFGLCKLNMKDGSKTTTFCGTPEYIAPELLQGIGYNKTVDYWTLGILLFEMLFGIPPFYDSNVNDMYAKILHDQLVIPDGASEAATDILTKLLNKNPEARLGAKSPDEIKNHAFFGEIDWQRLLQKKYIPPFKPNVESATDTSNFDEEFTKEVPTDSVIESTLSATVQQQFQGFTYQGQEVIGSVANAHNNALRQPPPNTMKPRQLGTGRL